MFCIYIWRRFLLAAIRLMAKIRVPLNDTLLGLHTQVKLLDLELVVAWARRHGDTGLWNSCIQMPVAIQLKIIRKVTLDKV